jgi:hypothetical protein
MRVREPGQQLSVGSMVLASAILACVILVLYRPVLSGYLWDDDFAWLVGGQRFNFLSAVQVSGRHHFYRPLIDVYFALTMWLFGYSPRIFHGLNLALHVLNACLVYALATRVLGTWSQALAAALVFAVLPGIITGVAWVSAVTALLMATCYLTAILAHLMWLHTGSRAARTTSVIAFIGALLGHEAAVTLLPMMMLAEWLLPRGLGRARRFTARSYFPFAIALAVYLAIAFQINRANYLVTEGHYRPGLHVINNCLQYITSLYVGPRGSWWYAITAMALLAILRFGSSRARFATAWMLIALLPYCFFEWGNIGRYMYLAAVGFSLMTIELIWSLAKVTGSPSKTSYAFVWAWILVGLVAGRFAAFTWQGTPGATTAGEPYRMWLKSFKQMHGTLPQTAIEIAEPADRRIDPRSIQPMIQLEYNEPNLEVRILPGSSSRE